MDQVNVYTFPCRPFPQNVSVFGMVLGSAAVGGLTYLTSKHIFKAKEPQKWAMYFAGGNAAFGLVKAMSAKCPPAA